MTQISFFNEPRSIRAVDSTTGVESFFHKNTLVIQCVYDPSNTTFFLRSDSYTGYYKFSDVVVPQCDDLLSLIRRLEFWVDQDAASQSTDAAGEQDAVLDLDVRHDAAPALIDEVRNDVHPYPVLTGVVAAGLSTPVSSTHSAVRAEVAMSAPAGGRIARQSKMYVACPSDRGMAATVGGRLLDTASGDAVGARCRIGMFDDGADVALGTVGAGNGLFFEYDYQPARDDYLSSSAQPNPYAVAYYAGLAPSKRAAFVTQYCAERVWVTLRSSYTGSQVDFKVPRFRWNADRLDVATQGSAVNMVSSSTQSFLFRWGGAPGALLSAGVLHNGAAVWVHEFDGGAAGQVLGAASLPVRWELHCAGAAGAAMAQASAVVRRKGRTDAPPRSFSFDNHVELRTLTLRQPAPLLALRLGAAANRARLRPVRMHLLNSDAGGAVKWEVRLNPALTGGTFVASAAFSFDTVDSSGAQSLALSGCFAEVDSAATAVTGGLTLASGYVQDAGVAEVRLDLGDAPLLANIRGDSDVLVIVATCIRGQVSVAAALEWQERP